MSNNAGKVPVERAWELITRPEHVRVWFAFDGAALDLRPGGAIEHHWKEHGTYRGVIEEVTPPKVLSYRYSVVPDKEPEPGAQTLVTFTLEPIPEGTRLHLVESGFAELKMTVEERDAHIAGTTQGWDGGLRALTDLADSVTA